MLDDDFQPSLETLRLIGVAAPTDEFHAAPQLADGDGGKKDRVAGVGELLRNATTPLFALSPFRASLMTFVSIKYTARVPAGLDPLEIRVNADGGHRRQNLGEAPPAGTRQRRGENGAMFGFRATAMRPGPLLERPDDVLVDAAHKQIRHFPTLRRLDDINDIIAQGPMGGAHGVGCPERTICPVAWARFALDR